MSFLRDATYCRIPSEPSSSTKLKNSMYISSRVFIWSLCFRNKSWNTSIRSLKFTESISDKIFGCLITRSSTIWRREPESGWRKFSSLLRSIVSALPSLVYTIVPSGVPSFSSLLIESFFSVCCAAVLDWAPTVIMIVKLWSETYDYS